MKHFGNQSAIVKCTAETLSPLSHAQIDTKTKGLLYNGHRLRTVRQMFAVGRFFRNKVVFSLGVSLVCRWADQDLA